MTHLPWRRRALAALCCVVWGAASVAAADRPNVLLILPDQLRAQALGCIGNWHLDGGKRDPGFVPPGPRRQGFEFWAACECRHTHFQPVWFHDTPEPVRGGKFEPEALTDVALEFLRENQKRPFFLVVS